MILDPAAPSPLYWALFPVLGPIYLIPLQLWRAARRRIRPQALLTLLALPGLFALAVGPVAAALRLVGSDGSLQLAARLRAISPLHAIGHDLLLSVRQVGILAPMQGIMVLLLAWGLLAVCCTAFLSPVYLWLAKRMDG